MQRSYYDTAGVLVLNKVTPIIEALFGPFNINPPYPGNGEASFFRLSEDAAPTWRVIRDNLFSKFYHILTSLSANCELPAVLTALAPHFDASDEPELQDLIQDRNLTGYVTYPELFTIATRLNDGHGLKAIKLESVSGHKATPPLYRFGGNGQYIGTHVSTFSSSSQAHEVGACLEAAISRGMLNRGAVCLSREVFKILAGINDEATRRGLQWKLADILLEDLLSERALLRVSPSSRRPDVD